MKERKIFTWLPTLYIGRALPYIILCLVSLVLFNRLGHTNGGTVFNTSLLLIPFIFRPMLRRFVTGYASDRFWIICMQMAFALSSFGVAKAIQYDTTDLSIILMFWLMAIFTAIHDVAFSRYCRWGINLPKKWKTMGCRFLWMGVAMIIGMGFLVMLGGNLEVINRVVRNSWMIVFYTLAGYFLFSSLWLWRFMPKGHNSRRIQIWTGLTSRRWKEMAKWAKEQPHTWAMLAFLLLYIVPECLFFRIAILFLIDPGSNGGLALAPQELSFIGGNIGCICFLLGCWMGEKAIQKHGFDAWLWPMTITLTLPKIAFIYLSFSLTSNLTTIGLCVAIDQLGTGFGLMAYIYYMVRQSQGPHPFFTRSVASSIAALSIILTGCGAGFLEEWAGYRGYFQIINLFNLLPFMVAALVWRKGGV